MAAAGVFRRWTIRVLLVLIVALLIWAARATVFADPPIAVTTATVETGRVEQTVTNSRAGTVKARRRTRLSPEIGGRAVAVPFREGNLVKAGQVVLTLDDRLQRSRVELAQRDLEAATAESHRSCVGAERSEREYRRIERLAGDRIVSEDTLDGALSARDTTEAACTAGKARVAQARAALDLAEVELDKMTLRAPFDGIVADVSIEVGEWTSPSPPALPIPPVIDLLDPGTIFVSAPMDEVDAALLHEGQPARITVDSHRGRSFPGTIVRVADFVVDLEQQNRTIEIEAELEDRALATELKPGTSADVEVILEAHEEALRVPASAVFEGDRVLVVVGGVLEERRIVPGLKNWDWVEVLDGLSEGETIVTTLDRAEIKAGAQVQE